jgi:hypothetical protein
LPSCLFLKEEYKDLETQLNKSFSEFIRQTFSFIHGMLNKAAHIEPSEQRENKEELQDIIAIGNLNFH